MRIAAPAGAVSSKKAADEMEAAINLLREALKNFVETIQKNGNWEDGCFYYHNVSASELVDPVSSARDILGLPN